MLYLRNVDVSNRDVIGEIVQRMFGGITYEHVNGEYTIHPTLIFMIIHSRDWVLDIARRMIESYPVTGYVYNAETTSNVYCRRKTTDYPRVMGGRKKISGRKFQVSLLASCNDTYYDIDKYKYDLKSNIFAPENINTIIIDNTGLYTLEDNKTFLQCNYIDYLSNIIVVSEINLPYYPNIGSNIINLTLTIINRLLRHKCNDGTHDQWVEKKVIKDIELSLYDKPLTEFTSASQLAGGRKVTIAEFDAHNELCPFTGLPFISRVYICKVTYKKKVYYIPAIYSIEEIIYDTLLDIDISISFNIEHYYCITFNRAIMPHLSGLMRNFVNGYLRHGISKSFTFSHRVVMNLETNQIFNITRDLSLTIKPGIVLCYY